MRQRRRDRLARLMPLRAACPAWFGSAVVPDHPCALAIVEQADQRSRRWLPTPHRSLTGEIDGLLRSTPISCSHRRKTLVPGLT